MKLNDRNPFKTYRLLGTGVPARIRWVFLVLLLMFVHGGTTVLRADTTFLDTTAIFAIPIVTSTGASNLSVTNASKDASFAVSSGGYFVLTGTGAPSTANLSSSSLSFANLSPMGLLAAGLPNFGIAVLSPSTDHADLPLPNDQQRLFGTGQSSSSNSWLPNNSAGTGQATETSAAETSAADITAVPEPGSLCLVGIGLALMVFCRRAVCVRG